MKQKKLLILISISLWSIIFLVGLLQLPLQEKLATNTLGLSLYDDILVTKNNTISPEDFIFALSKKNIPLELYKDTNYAATLSNDTYWFLLSGDKFTDFIHSPEHALSLVQIAKPQLDHLSVYLLDDSYQVLDTFSMGRKFSYYSRPLNHRDYIVPIDNASKVDSVLFQVKTDSYLQFPVTLWHEQDWLNFLHLDLLGHGLFYGGLLVMFIYNLILGISLKDKTNTYFSLFVFSFILMQATWDGFSFQYLWPNNGLWDLMANPLSIHFASLSFVLFSAHLLTTKKTPHSLIYYSIICTHVLGMLLTFLFSSHVSVYIAMFNASLTLFFSFYLLYKKGLRHRTEILYLMAWQFFLGANLLNILSGVKLLPYTIITATAPKFAIIGLVALFSLALSEKFNTIKYLNGVETEKRKLLKTLNHMHKKISSTQNFHTIFSHLLNEFGSMTKFEDGLIVLIDQDMLTCDIYSKDTQTTDMIELSPTQLDQLNTLIHAKHISNLTKDVYSSSNAYEDIIDIFLTSNTNQVNSVYLIPLINLGTPIGFVLLKSKVYRHLDAITKETINSFASQIAITLNNTRLFNKVTYQAHYDDLTGAYNRRYFLELAQKIITEIPSNEHISVIMIDIDDFKHVNDTYGHIVGDSILQASVKRITSLLDSSSVLGRYGGEEFIILHHAHDAKAIHPLTQKLLTQFSNEPFIVPGNQKNLKLQITISIGVATSRHFHSIHELTDKADALLYQAKANGKNTICYSTRDSLAK